MLASASQFFLSLFSSSCDCAEVSSSVCDLICPDFEPEAVEKVLELISGHGLAILSNSYILLMQVTSILECFKIKIDLPPVDSFKSLFDEILEIRLDTEEDLDGSIAEVFDEEISSAGGDITDSHDNNFLSTKTLGDIPSRMNTTSSMITESETTETHSMDSSFICRICDKKFSMRISFDQHMLKHEQSGPVESRIINPPGRAAKRKLTAEDTLEVEKEVPEIIDISVPDHHHACDVCQQNFPNRDKLEAHKMSHLQVLESADSLHLHRSNESERSLSSQNMSTHEDLEPAMNQSEKISTSASCQKIAVNNNGLSPMYQCHICQCKMSKYNNLINHIGGVHLRTELQKFMSKEKPQTCLLCQKEATKFNHMASHLIQKHKVLDGMIPSKEKLTVKISNDVPEVCQEKEDNAQVQEESVQEPVVVTSSGKRKRFKCPLCNVSMAKSILLMTHVATEHYKEELRSKFGMRDDWSCGECQQSFKNEVQLINHLVTVHSALKNFITLAEDTNNEEGHAENSIANVSGASENESAVDESMSGSNDETLNESAFDASLNEKAAVKLRASTSLSPREGVMGCPKCKYSATNFMNLYAHVACLHYRYQLLAMSGHSKTCRLCDKTFIQKNALLVHVARVHNGLKGVFPLSKSDFILQQTRISEGVSLDKNGSHDADDSTKQEEYPIAKVQSAVSTQPQILEGEGLQYVAAEYIIYLFQCPVCKKQEFTKYEKLLSHLAKTHHKAMLLQTFANNKKTTTCNICCDETFLKDQDELAEHLAVHHSLLVGHVPSKDSLAVLVPKEENTCKTRFECLNCGRLVNGLGPMKMHIRFCLDKLASTAVIDAKDQVLNSGFGSG